MSTSKPLLLDLFSGAGGAAVGYHEAGFYPVGVDNRPMPRYPFRFVQFDAFAFLESVIANGTISQFTAIHASPPCQAYSKTWAVHKREHPRLLEPARRILQRTGLPYVIENVPQAPLENPVMLCGSQFGLQMNWKGASWQGEVYLQRHRGFETNFPVPDPGPHDHTRKAVTVAGHGRQSKLTEHFRGGGYNQLSRDIMKIDWMNQYELTEAIPPAYTHYVGTYLMKHLETL